MFTLVKIISRLLFPVPLSMGIASAGLFVVCLTRRKRLGRIMVGLGITIVLVLSSQVVSEALIAPLEWRYLPHRSTGTAVEDLRYVVVLAGGVTRSSEYPVTRQVGAHSMMRLIEGVRVYRLYPGSQIVLSGGYGADPDTPLELLTNYAMVRELHVPPEAIIVKNNSRNTEEEARNLAPMLGAHPFVLVTSASHMPRAMVIFRQAGLHPIPAPTDYATGLCRVRVVESYLPDAGNLKHSERAIYEYLGLLWLGLRGTA